MKSSEFSPDRFEAFTWEMTDVDNLWLAAKPLQEKYDQEKVSLKGFSVNSL